MKTKLPSVLALSILAVSLSVSAQQQRVAPVAPQQVPRSNPQVGQPPFQRPGQPPLQATGELPHNVKLTLEGSLFGTIPTDFSITTGGTSIETNLPLDGEGPAPAPLIGTLQAELTPGEPWQVQVSLIARVPISRGNNIEYTDFRLSTTVRIDPGKKVVLWQKGEQKLTLGMEKVED
jgi:hypothetical protein